MTNFIILLDILQLILAISLIILIILQQRSSEGGAIFGSKTEFFFKRRGFEKNLFYLTWILVVVFIFVSILKIQ